MLTKEDHITYAQILREELTPAFGCTEPIALAYCAAKAREVLGEGFLEYSNEEKKQNK